MEVLTCMLCAPIVRRRTAFVHVSSDFVQEFHTALIVERWAIMGPGGDHQARFTPGAQMSTEINILIKIRAPFELYEKKSSDLACMQPGVRTGVKHDCKWGRLNIDEMQIA